MYRLIANRSAQVETRSRYDEDMKEEQCSSYTVRVS